MFQSLVSGGGLVFSVEHPLYTAPAEPGWSLSTSGRPTWPVDSYLEEGPRSTDWLAKGAQPSETVEKLLNISGAMSTMKVRTGGVHVVGVEKAPDPAPASAPAAVEEEATAPDDEDAVVTATDSSEEE